MKPLSLGEKFLDNKPRIVILTFEREIEDLRHAA
jgi:hypothetical protein